MALAYSDIAAVSCDSRIVRWQDGIAPYIISVLLTAFAAFAAFAVAAKAMVSAIAFMVVHSARVQRLCRAHNAAKERGEEAALQRWPR